jgi:hypothetical protein
MKNIIQICEAPQHSGTNFWFKNSLTIIQVNVVLGARGGAVG